MKVPSWAKISLWLSFLGVKLPSVPPAAQMVDTLPSISLSSDAWGGSGTGEPGSWPWPLTSVVLSHESFEHSGAL